MLVRFELAMLFFVALPVGVFFTQIWLNSRTGLSLGEALQKCSGYYRSVILWYIPCSTFVVMWYVTGPTWQNLLVVYIVHCLTVFIGVAPWYDSLQGREHVMYGQDSLVKLRWYALMSLGSFLAAGYMFNSTNLLREPVVELA